MRDVLCINSDATFLDQVGASIGEKLPPEGVGQSNLDVIVAGLHAESGLHRQRACDPLERARQVRPDQRALVELMELITIGWVGQKEREIVEQVERTFDYIGVGPPVAGVVGMDPLPGT